MYPPDFPTARHLADLVEQAHQRNFPDDSPRRGATCRITGLRADLFLTRSDLERTVPILFVTLLRGARCQGCGSTVDLARDWLGIAWRDENGRHSCPA